MLAKAKGTDNIFENSILCIETFAAFLKVSNLPRDSCIEDKSKTVYR